MADNFLERQYADYEQRKKGGKCLSRSQRQRFYTRPVVTSTHEERQREIEAKNVNDNHNHNANHNVNHNANVN